MTIRTTQHDQPPTVRIKSLWNTYTALCLLKRGGKVIIACTHKVPAEMVAIKKLSSDYVKELRKYQHKNLLAIIDLKLDSSKVLFLLDGYTKIAHFDKCQSTELAAACSIGVIAVKMMQNGIPPEADKKLTLKHPEQWSAEASNFLEVISWGTLKDIKKNKFLKYVLLTVIKPFVEYTC
ncbi:hypothetical protein B0J14DRAFT_610274 [Halenospora varia]|nr:hypothetical protein B0J14DRAFT_610274 [Halenospora varia]